MPFRGTSLTVVPCDMQASEAPAPRPAKPLAQTNGVARMDIGALESELQVQAPSRHLDLKAARKPDKPTRKPSRSNIHTYPSSPWTCAQDSGECATGRSV